jgi:hypothetical protein
VIGSEETDDLESQIRGSRYAWQIRLLGVRALIKLLKTKEQLDDPAVARQIREILFPAEFTRLDRIVDLVFQTATDLQDIEPETPDPKSVDSSEDPKDPDTKPPANFHAAIVPKLIAAIKQPLIKVSRVVWATADKQTAVSCQASKEFESKIILYWYGLKRTTRDQLEKAANAFCAFGLGSADRVVMLPYRLVRGELEGCFTSPDNSGGILHWHLRFERREEKVYFMTDRDRGRLDVTEYLLRDPLN